MKTTAPRLLPLLRSRLQGDLLSLLYLHPDKEYSLSELAKLLGTSARMIHFECGRLTDAGFVTDRRVGNVRLLRARSESPVARALQDLLMVTFGPLPVLTEMLDHIAGVNEAFIYGSWAARYSGEKGDIPDDIDVLVVGEASRAALDEIAEMAERRLHRHVNIRRIDRETWDAPPKDNTFLISLKSRPLVSLHTGGRLNADMG